MAAGRTLRNVLSEDMKTRIQQLQNRCKDLTSKYDRRLAMQTNITVVEGFQKSVDDDFGTSVPEPIRINASLTVRFLP